jgi:hypothetical protein
MFSQSCKDLGISSPPAILLLYLQTIAHIHPTKSVRTGSCHLKTLSIASWIAKTGPALCTNLVNCRVVVRNESDALAPSTLCEGKLVAIRSEMKFWAEVDVASRRPCTDAENPELKIVLCRLFGVLAAPPASPAPAVWLDMACAVEIVLSWDGFK